MPPVPASCWLKATSTTLAGNGDAVAMLGAVVMVRSKVLVAVRPFESVMSTVKLLVPVVAGMPLKRPPVLSVSPAGNVPKFTVN